MNLTTDTYGCTHPARAVVIIEGHSFECDEPADWENSLNLASMTGGVVSIPEGTPGEYWMAAAKQFAAMVICSCGQRPLDPTEVDAFALRLCEPCYEREGWENTHSDEGHDTTPDPDNCPICKEAS